MNLETVKVWLEILQYVAIIFTAIFAIVQYIHIKKARRQEKAANIMLKYSDILHKTTLVKSAIESDANIMNVVNKINRKTPLSFALYERNEYGINDEDVTRYMTYIENQNPLPISMNIGGKMVSYKEIIPGHIAKELPESCSIYHIAIFTLNEIEYLSMEIESGAVDDEYLYGALHQTLLPFIHMLAILIQSLNKSSLPEENYYTYIQKLYGRWVMKEAKNYKKMKRKLKGRVKNKG